MATCDCLTPRESYAESNENGPLYGARFFGAGTRTRTADLRFTKPLLYQLSYTGDARQDAHYSLLN